MIKRFYSKKRANQDILSSKLFDETTFYKAFVKDIKKAKKSVVIESPFLSEKRAYNLSVAFKKLKKRKVRCIVYTRMAKHQPYYLRSQVAGAVQILKEAGVTVFECGDFRHRKVAVIDKRVLWEGSLNILSQSKSRETMRRIESKPLAKQMQRLLIS